MWWDLPEPFPLWPLPFATSSAELNLWPPWLLTMTCSFRIERMSFLSRQADMLLVMGTIAKKWRPIYAKSRTNVGTKNGYRRGACACSGGVFDLILLLQGYLTSNSVDVYVPGCPPRPEQILDGIMKLQDIVKMNPVRRRSSNEYKDLLGFL